MADGKRVAQAVVGGVVGVAAPQVVADYSGAHAVRNGVGTAIGTFLLGAAGNWLGKGKLRFAKSVGQGLMVGTGAWGLGVAVQHLDQALQAPKPASTGSVQAGVRAVQAMSGGPVDAVQIPARTAGRPVTEYQYPTSTDFESA